MSPDSSPEPSRPARPPRRRPTDLPDGAARLWRALRRRLGRDARAPAAHPLDRFVRCGAVHPSVRYELSSCYLQHGAGVRIGADSMICGRIQFHRPARLTIGRRCYIGRDTELHITTGITIGDDVLISWQCTLIDTDMHSQRFGQRRRDVLITAGRGGLRPTDKDWSAVPSAPITIGDRAWIGLRVIILKGVRIGQGAIVGAGSVVSRDVPAWTLVAGNPARPVRQLPPEPLHEQRVRAAGALLDVAAVDGAARPGG